MPDRRQGGAQTRLLHSVQSFVVLKAEQGRVFGTKIPSASSDTHWSPKASSGCKRYMALFSPRNALIWWKSGWSIPLAFRKPVDIS